LFRRSGRRDPGGVLEPPRISRGKRGQTELVHALAAEQQGVVARAQLLASGVSRWAIDRAVRSGRLHRLHPGVYSLPAPELLTEDAHLTAALLAAGHGAILARGSAAWRWQLIPAPPITIEVLTPHERRLRPGDRAHDGRFPLTSVPRTLLDLATHYHHHALLRALAEAEFHHDIRPADIKRTLRRGHPGSANLRAALDAHAPGHGTVKSQLERKFRRLLIKHDIELPLRNEEIGPWTVDCLWPEQRLVVELDGGQHTRPAQATRDDDRDLWLRRHGYTIRRYGEKQLTQQPHAVIEDLLYAGAGVPLKL
jgi:very-short-patch-repair endonuclease